mmetsp:Transcript_32085/g.31817  ORF Transcript_32085/g.31817 Transcript_32085/m.31817 type:complete len:370 (+) Transcript_32085:47-1156(+)
MASPDEVTVSSTQGFGRQVTQVATLLETKRQAKITAINLAIPSAVNLVELIKHKVKGLYQINSFERVPNSNKTRVVFLLSLDPLDASSKGYQPPIPESQVESKTLAELKNQPTRSATEENKRPPVRREQYGREEHKPAQHGTSSKPHETAKEGETRKPANKPYSSSERTERAPRGTRGDRVSRGNRGDRGDRAERGERRGGSRGPRGSRGRGYGNFQGERRVPPEQGKYVRETVRETTKKEDNEIFVSMKGSESFFLKQALLLLKKDGKRTIVIKASGAAIPKAVKVVEDIKRHELGLHQLNNFNNRKIQVLYHAQEEGLEDRTAERDLTGVEIILSKDEQDRTHTGYQAPLPASQVKSISIEEVEKLR